TVLTVPAALTAEALLVAGRASGIPDEPGPQAEARIVQPPAAAPRPLEVRIGGNDPASVALRDTLPAATGAADPYYFTFALIRLAKARHASGDRDGALAAFRLADRVADTVRNQHLRRLALMRTAVARGGSATRSRRGPRSTTSREAAGL